MGISTAHISAALIGFIALFFSIVFKFLSLKLEKQIKEVNMKRSIKENLAFFLASNTNVASAIGASGAAGILWS